MPTLYLDMDGVLTDFNGYAAKLLNATEQETRQAAENGRWTPKDWEILKQTPNLFRKLPKTEIADDLVNLARKFRDELGWNISTLTAVPKNNDVPDAFQDKLEWMQENYPDVRVRFGPFSTDKARHARSGDILVDDRRDNCEQWTDAGGQAIRVLDTDRTQALEKLQEIYDKKISLQRLSRM